MHLCAILIQCFIIVARFLASSYWRIVSATRFERSVDRVDMALTLTALDPVFFIHSDASNSSGKIEQKIFISLIVNWRASSNGSKSKMLGELPPIFQLFRVLN